MADLDELVHDLTVKFSYADLVINVGNITLGENNRKKLTDSQRMKEKNKIMIAACALLNSGGGVIHIEMQKECTQDLEIGQDLEQSLKELIDPFHFHTYFATLPQEKYYFIFVKSWSSGISSKDNSIIPRICSYRTILLNRNGTSISRMNSTVAINFLINKKKELDSREDGPPGKVFRIMNTNIEERDPVSVAFEKDCFERGEVLPFPESTWVEFKQFSTKNIDKYLKEVIPKYVSSFANTAGGYLFIGVKDGSKEVEGALKELVDPDSLKETITRKINNLLVVHFYHQMCSVNHTVKIQNVYDNGELYSYVFAVKVEVFEGAVFLEEPISWFVKDGCIRRLSPDEWMNMILDADPDISNLAESFHIQLSLDHCPPLCRPVYCKNGLEDPGKLQQCLFPESLKGIQYNPNSVCQELFLQHEGLKELMDEQILKEKCSQGMLIFSRSWAVDIGLEENQNVISDALLIAPKSFPILYTVFREPLPDAECYSIHTACTLKQKLVNTGGYAGRICIIPKILILNSESDAAVHGRSNQAILYPEFYKITVKTMRNLLWSLVIVLFSFRSFLSDQLGHEVLNLLTSKQYEIISKNLHKTPELFVHGLPGTGKTIIAMKIMEKIKNVFRCETEEILYICENQPLKDFIKKKNICKAVTRTYFMSDKFNAEKIKHIIIDEAQSFRQKEGPWYWKAKNITHKTGSDPGTFWIFLDYFQTSHVLPTGLPNIYRQYPREELTKVVRNADSIGDFIKKNMEIMKTHPSLAIPQMALKMLDEIHWSSGVQGTCVIKHDLTKQEIVTFVVEKCKKLFQRGYSFRDIAILVSTVEDIDCYERPLRQATQKIRGLKISGAFNVEGNYVILDSIRRFSGLERKIVFGLNPKGIESVSLNLLVCLASRAIIQLYVLYEREDKEMGNQENLRGLTSGSNAFT